MIGQINSKTIKIYYLNALKYKKNNKKTLFLQLLINPLILNFMAQEGKSFFKSATGYIELVLIKITKAITKIYIQFCLINII